MRTRRALAFASIAALMVGCVGSDPAPTSVAPNAPSTGSRDESPAGNEAGAPAPTEPGTADAGGDAAPPACTKISVSTLAGAGGAGSANGAGNVATFDAPEGITVDPANGTLYIADTGNQLVRKVLSSGMTSTMPGTGTWITPKRVAFSYYLYVVDNGHDQVYTVAPNGDVAGDFALGNMQAFAIQPSLFEKFAANGYSIAKHISANGISATGFSGTYPGGFADGQAANAKYQGAVDLAFDDASNVLVADLGNHRIRKVTVSAGADNGNVVTLAGSATAGHVDGTGAAAQFEGPNALFVDPATHLAYVADGPTIRVVTAAGEVSTLVGSSSAFVDGDGCTAKFVNIKGITKFANELYVTDVNRIRKIVMN